MTLVTEREIIAEAAVTDRRRPGRLKEVSPELIPILRAPDLSANLDEDMALEDDDQLAGLRGVASGLALSIPLWVGIAYVGRWLLS